jgi:hypothetical protein
MLLVGCQSCDQAKTGTVSVLIPARDEEGSIAVALEAVLNTVGVDLEVLVLDDGSRDRTADLVAGIARRDSRVTLIPGEPLPPGWCGKQFACWQLARKSKGNVLLFLDADVRIAPSAIPRAMAFLQEQQADLASCVPRQETETFLERLLIPFILFLLLGFLPLRRMPANQHPAYAAGCGQFLLARRHAYFSCGGHSTIRASLHDGLRLPATFRAAGLRTDLFDGTDAATCRMYEGARAVWSGLAKNATEGLAHPARILPATFLLLGGQVLPAVILGTSTDVFASFGRAVFHRHSGAARSSSRRGSTLSATAF